MCLLVQLHLHLLNLTHHFNRHLGLYYVSKMMILSLLFLVMLFVLFVKLQCEFRVVMYLLCYSHLRSVMFIVAVLSIIYVLPV